MRLVALFCLLLSGAAAQTQLSLSCRQSQLPLPLLRVLATTSGGTAPLTGINVQTALPFNATGTLGVNPGVWNTEEYVHD
jgi:hypothetical protein